MSETTLNLTATDGHRITGTLFCPDTPGAALVISHGMAEHGNRYAGLARWLGTQGVAVVTYHHRGHGPDCRPEDLGHYEIGRASCRERVYISGAGVVLKIKKINGSNSQCGGE